MAGKRKQEVVDPGNPKKLLPAGVSYLGPERYRARKLVKGQRESRIFATAQSARDWLDEVVADVRRGKFKSTNKARQWTVAQTLTAYRDEVLGRRTQRHVATDLGAANSIIRDRLLGPIRMDELEHSDLNKFADRLKDTKPKPYSGHTIIKRLRLIHTAIEHCRGRYYSLASDPFEGVEWPKKPPSRKRVLGEGEEDRIWIACRSARWPYFELFVRWLAVTAMRAGEAVSVDIERDIRYTMVEGTLLPIIRVRGLSGEGSKNGLERDVPILPQWVPLLVAILAQPRAPGDTRLFPVPLSAATRALPADVQRARAANTCSLMWIRARARVGLVNLRLHDLRHVACTNLPLYFPNPADAAKISGHEDLKVFMKVYYNVDTGEDLHQRALMPGENLQGALARLQRQQVAGLLPPPAAAPTAPDASGDAS